MNSAIQAQFDELKGKVAAQTSVVESASALLNGLSAQIAALKAQIADGGDPAVIAAITELETTVDANRQALADAVALNTQQA